MQSKTLLLFKKNTLEFAFDRHLEHRANYHGMQNGLPVSLVGTYLDFQDLNANIAECLQSLISSTGNTKFSTLLLRGTGDFQESRHVSKQIAMTQKLYTRGGKSIHFLKALCLLFPKKF